MHSRDLVYPYIAITRRRVFFLPQIRQGIATNSKGTAFVVYEDVIDAKQACDKLNGFNFQNRYLVVLYHQPEKMARSKEDLAARQENLERLKQQHGID
ncbi:pre-mRNA branch site protein p14 [Paracoccidioides lutzii Pb01]|uniref:Pre-mRNA branch site protein p14 n=1 Tax=Paracoccidioides lutzii (strain ATCC MYA-826 / Pb01) TaxID=502779 RepID=C1GR67_PARBA|nr:pre-mRNA branch site protein p14 [Paracoccidioides lutzii Pb01]EEH38091.2 pre-mRNA branch site protein p14 [Paracoccidioides lutzii Pb01]